MVETTDLTRQILEEHFNVDECDDGENLELETWTEYGVNMIIYVNKDNIIRDFCGYTESFDIDEEIEIYRQDERYRNAFTIRKSLEDFEAYKRWLEDIGEQLQGRVKNMLASFINLKDTTQIVVYEGGKAKEITKVTVSEEYVRIEISSNDRSEHKE